MILLDEMNIINTLMAGARNIRRNYNLLGRIQLTVVFFMHSTNNSISHGFMFVKEKCTCSRQTAEKASKKGQLLTLRSEKHLMQLQPIVNGTSIVMQAFKK